MMLCNGNSREVTGTRWALSLASYFLGEGCLGLMAKFLERAPVASAVVETVIYPNKMASKIDEINCRQQVNS